MAIFEFPVSAAQSRMWLLEQIDPGHPTYNMAWAVWLDGALNPGALERAWAGLVARHEALRTTFRRDRTTAVQVVDDDPPPPVLDFRSVRREAQPSLDDAVAEAWGLLSELARRPFDLGRGPLHRLCLIELAPGHHVLSVVAHHIIADGWSVQLLFDELAADYASLSSGTPALTAAPAVQYPDFAVWQLEHTEAGGYAQAERFWQEELADSSVMLPLPVDYPYPQRPSFAAAEVEFTVPAATVAAVRLAVATRQTTLFSAVMAAYGVVLAKVCAVEDLLIGVPVAARLRPETESMIGLFVNTIAIRLDLSRDPTLGQVVDGVHAAMARTQDHQELPFARVVELLRPQRLSTRSALVQVFCAVEQPWSAREHGGLRWRPQLLGTETGKFELELSIVDDPDSLTGHLRYYTDLFSAQTAQRLVDGIQLVLQAFADSGATSVSNVEILTPATRELVTRVWPVGGPPAGRGDETVADLALAACVGDRIVVEDSDASFTGAQLGDFAARIAACLCQLGVRLQDSVGIALPRGALTLPAVLGAWWVGAAYLPLDPANPVGRLRAMVADSGVRVVITDRTAVPGVLLSELDRSVTVVDLSELRRAADEPVRTARRRVPPDAAAYVLFTSGSTGRPKAVTVTHGSVAQMLCHFKEVLAVSEGDRVVAVSTATFDMAVFEMVFPLLCGAAVVVADADQVIDGARLRRLLRSTGATMLQATPTTWRLLAEAGGVPDRVRVRLSGGEPLPRDLAESIVTGDSVALWNVYGPTETTVYSTGGRVLSGRGPVDIGSAIAGTQVYLLDQWLRPVLPGVIGEVFIGGAGVSRGYLGAPGLTAQRYLPDPFGDKAGARLYRTGDLGRWQPDGRIDLLGRIDRQVKVRGFRVETAEIEAALRAHPDVSDAVVTTVTVGAADVRLVGYVVTSTPQPSVALRPHLRQLLPDYMLPSTLVAMDELPRTTSGKVDHNALPQPRWGGDCGEPMVAARTDLERQLIEVVAGVLNLTKPIGVLDNFFVLGGHSLTATQLMARVWTSYGVDLPVRSFFDDPTVAALAAAITASRAVADGAASTPISGSNLEQFLDGLTDQDVDELLGGPSTGLGLR